MTIFLTGATGFLGSSLLKKLLMHGHRIICLKRPNSNLSRISSFAKDVEWQITTQFNENSFFSKTSVDFIVHCATNYGRKIIDPLITIEANLILPLKLLHAAALNSVPFFVNTDTILDKGIDNYSRSKKQFTEWLESYQDRITGFNLSLEHFYGGGDDRTKFLSSIIHALLTDVEKIDLTLGEQKRDFIHIDDVINAFISVIEQAPSFKRGFYRFDVGTGKTESIRNIVEMVRKLIGNESTRLNFGALPYRANEVMETVIDIQSLQKLGWSPAINLIDGLRQTISEETKELSCVF